MMRGFFSVLVLAFSLIATTATSQNAINWMTIEEAMAAQQDEPRPILMDVYTQWCGPCKMMMNYTFTNTDVIRYVNEHYYAVKFDAEGPDPVNFLGETYTNAGYNPNSRGRNSPHSFSQALGVRAYPTLIFMSEKGQIMAPITGYKTAQQLEIFLVFFSEHWTPATGQPEWDAFSSSFAPSFQ